MKNKEVIHGSEARHIYSKKLIERKESYKLFVIKKVNNAVESGAGRVKIDCRQPQEVRDFVVSYLESKDYDVDVDIPGKIRVYWNLG